MPWYVDSYGNTREYYLNAISHIPVDSLTGQQISDRLVAPSSAAIAYAEQQKADLLSQAITQYNLNRQTPEYYADKSGSPQTEVTLMGEIYKDDKLISSGSITRTNLDKLLALPGYRFVETTTPREVPGAFEPADPYAGGYNPETGQGLPFVKVGGVKVKVTDIAKGRNAKVLFINEVLNVSDSVG